MTVEEMEYAVARMFNIRTHLIVPNVSWGLLNYEADLLVARQSRYLLEFEIKRSFSDYKNDFLKRKWKVRTRTGETDVRRRIKEFYFCFPEKLWLRREQVILKILPDELGVVVVYKIGYDGLPKARIIKSAKQNRKCRPLTEKEMFVMARLGMIRVWDLKRRLINKEL